MCIIIIFNIRLQHQVSKLSDILFSGFQTIQDSFNILTNTWGKSWRKIRLLDNAVLAYEDNRLIFIITFSLTGYLTYLNIICVFSTPVLPIKRFLLCQCLIQIYQLFDMTANFVDSLRWQCSLIFRIILLRNYRTLHYMINMLNTVLLKVLCRFFLFRTHV